MTVPHIVTTVATQTETDDAYVLPISGIVLVTTAEGAMTEVRAADGATLAVFSGTVDAPTGCEIEGCPGALLTGAWTGVHHRGQPGAWAVALGTVTEDGLAPQVSFLRRRGRGSALMQRRAIEPWRAGDLWVAEAPGIFTAVYAAGGLERYGRRFAPVSATRPRTHAC